MAVKASACRWNRDYQHVGHQRQHTLVCGREWEGAAGFGERYNHQIQDGAGWPAISFFCDQRGHEYATANRHPYNRNPSGQ
jgi:hypothetical protein